MTLRDVLNVVRPSGMFLVSQVQLVAHAQARDFRLALAQRIIRAIVPIQVISLNRQDFITEPSNIIRVKREKDPLLQIALFADFVVWTDRVGQILVKNVKAQNWRILTVMHPRLIEFWILDSIAIEPVKFIWDHGKLTSPVQKIVPDFDPAIVISELIWMKDEGQIVGSIDVPINFDQSKTGAVIADVRLTNLGGRRWKCSLTQTGMNTLAHPIISDKEYAFEARARSE